MTEPMTLTRADVILYAALIVYVGACFGMIAAKHGKNPLIYGLLSIVTPINLIILGIWAFKGVASDSSSQKD